MLSARQIIGVGYCYGPKGHNSGVCKVIFRAMCEDVDGRGSSGVSTELSADSFILLPSKQAQAILPLVTPFPDAKLKDNDWWS